MTDSLNADLLAELKTLNASIAGLKDEIGRAASLVAASQLIAVDASRSEVYATLMDDHLVETARRLVTIMAAGPTGQR